MRVLVTMPEGEVRSTFFPPELRHRLDELGKVEWNEREEQFAPEDLAERLTGVDACKTG